jgi:hypothetical protein
LAADAGRDARRLAKHGVSFDGSETAMREYNRETGAIDTWDEEESDAPRLRLGRPGKTTDNQGGPFVLGRDMDFQHSGRSRERILSDALEAVARLFLMEVHPELINDPDASRRLVEARYGDSVRKRLARS